MAVRVFFDTNVLLYSALDSGEDERKRNIARELLQSRDGVLSVQVLQEFVAQATRPSRPDRLTIDEALTYVSAWRRFPVQETTLPLFEAGLVIFERQKLSFWDSMVVAAARAQGCEILYSEDMQDGRMIDGLRIVDPFR